MSNRLGISASFATLAGVLAAGLLGACATGPSSPGDDSMPSSEVLAAYVATPNGYYHASCVHDVGDDAVFDVDGTVALADGSSLSIGSCAYPKLDVLPNVTSGTHNPTTNGWVLDSNWTAPRPATKMTSTFKVPTAPATKNGQLDYFFPGMEPADGTIILQPVLSYGDSPAGGGNEWGIASWSCGASCVHSTFHVVDAGDTLVGTITGSSCTSSGSCNWAIVTQDTTHAATTTLNTKNDQEAYVWLFGGVLEAYDVSACNEYPKGTEVFTGVDFSDATGAALTPAYTNEVLDATTCKTVKVASTAANTTLTF